jgi:hypothetical protein
MKTKTDPRSLTRTPHHKATMPSQTWCKRISVTLFALALSATASLAQNVNVNPGAGSYPTLKAAFDAINAGTHTGAVTVNIVGDTTEAASAVLNASGAGSASYTSIVISPSGGVGRNISGSGLAAVPLIDLNGADSVTIDGLNTGGNALTISNPSTTSGASTIRFIADATSNTVQNCLIQGSGTSATSGTIVFSTGAASGNDGNIINANSITSVGLNLPTNAIYSAGTSVAIDNSGISITNNNIFDYFNAGAASNGILVASNSSAWTITGNKFFQGGTRTSTVGSLHTAIQIVTASGGGYTINTNTIGFSNAGGTGSSTYAGAFANRFAAMDLTLGGAVSNIQGNTITGFTFSTTSGATTAGAGIFQGITLRSGPANIGTTTGNTIGATTGTGTINVTSTTSLGYMAGIYSTSTAAVSIQNNNVGAWNTGGAASIGYTFVGIDTAGTAGNVTTSSNTIGSTATANSIAIGLSGTTTAVTTFIGIRNTATGTISITGNTIQNCSSFTSGAGIWTGITNTGGLAGSTLAITTNNVLNGTLSGTGAFTCISNTATTGTLNINSNVIRSHSKTAASGAFTGISNTGAQTVALNINSNQLGNASGGLITFSIANSTAITGITAGTPAVAATLSINSNDFRGIVYTAAGTGAHTYITWGYQGSGAGTISSNTFTNLSINTTGAVTFLNHGTLTNMTATGSMAISSNQVVTGFANASVSATTFCTSSTGDSSVNGSAITYNLNNFSNVTLTGASAVIGISDSNGASNSSGPTKTITNNTFNSITTGAAQITGISFNFSGNNTTVSNNTLTNLTGGLILALASGTSNSGTTETISGNTFSNFTASGQVNVLQTGLGPNLTTGNITGNTITNISSSAATANPIFGIICSGFGATSNISKNKIGNIQSTGNALAGSSLFGILAQTAGTTYNIFNNLVGDLRLPVNPAANNLQGISIGGTLTAGTTVNVSFNTVWLNETVNAVAGFGSSAVFASTTPTVVMRNNILVNRSVFNGTGLTVAYRRGDATLTTYGAASNNNDFYAGTPGTNNLIYNDVTNSDQTIAAYKARVASRDSASFTENPTFLSTAAASSTFLHIDSSVATQLESGGSPVAGITDDFDGDTRNVSTPDVGADEFSGIAIDLSPPAISYATLSNTTASATRSFTNVTVTDATGVNIAPGTRPRVYYKKSTNANAFNNNTNATDGWKYVEADGAGGSPFSFTIDYSLLFGGAGVTANDVIQYFVVAQDTVTPTPNVGINSGTFAATPSSVALTSAAFPIGGSINSYTIIPFISGGKTVGSGGDYATLTAAVAALNGAVLNGSLTLTLTDATYPSETYPITINANSGSSAANFVLIKPASTISPSFSGSSTSCMINLNGADWIIIDGSNALGGATRDLTFTNTSTSATTADVCLTSTGVGAGATNNIVMNTNLVGSTVTATAGTLAGVFSGSSTISITSAGADNDNNTIQNNRITKTSYGIYTGGASAANKNVGTVVTQNVMNAASPNNITTGGVFANFEDGIQITRNDISVLRHDGTTGQTVTAFGIALGVVPNATLTAFTGSDVVNAVVSRNKINGITQLNATGYSAFGIVVNSVTSGTTLVSNNMVCGVISPVTGPSDFSAGIVAGGGTGSTTQIYLNSVSITGVRASTATFPSYGLAINSGNPVVDVRDNIFYNTQTTAPSGTAKSYAIAAASTTFSNMTSNFNDFFVSGTNTFVGQTGGLGTVGTDRPALVGAGGWQATTATDANSIFADPTFLSAATNLHIPATSPARDAGTTIGSITVDFDGDTRPQLAAYDIGADEVLNTAPTITAAAGVTRQQGSPVSNSTIATVNDTETGPGSVIVTVTSANPSNGVTISNIVNGGGAVTADVVAACGATNATFTLQASDGTLTATDSLNVSVTANTAPTLTYNNDSVAFNGSTSISPATGPSDNGSVSTIAVQSTGTYTGTISVDNVTGIVSISNAAPLGSHTITIRATDNCGLTTDAIFTLTVNNTAPTIAAAGGVTRQQGSPSSNSTIASVNDTESGAGSVVVTVISSNPSNGVTISNIVNSGGLVTADVVASCGATNANFTLQASDGSLTATDSLSVTVTANAAPTLSYNNASVAFNGSTSVNPATGPSDNGSVSTIAVQSTGTYTGTISVDSGTGIVSISNAAPGGSHTITIRATDNCGAITDTTFTLTVAAQPAIVYVDDDWTSVPNGQDPDGVGGPATAMGYDAFATIQGGIDGVAPSGTVNVYAGTYTQAGTIGLNKSLILQGPNTAISPNGGSRAPEALITGAVNPILRISLPATVVTIQGFKFDNTGVVDDYETGQSITVRRNIYSNGTGGGAFYFLNSPASLTIDDNYVINPAGDGEDAIFVVGNWNGTSGTTLSLTNNVMENSISTGMNLSNVSGAITGNRFTNLQYYAILLANGSGSITISGNTFDGIVNPSPGVSPTWGAGVRFYQPNFVGSVVIKTNLFANSYCGVGVRGVPNDAGATIAGQDIQINFNSFINNTYGISDGAAGTLNAENNWWSCNFGPGVGGAGCTGTANGVLNSGSGSVDANPWIVLGIGASPNPIAPGGTSTVTADMTHNSDNAVPSGTDFVPDVSVAFTALEGTMTPPSGTITNGQETSLFTSTSANDGSASATVNNQIVSTTIDVDAPSFAINDVTQAETDGGQTSFIFTVTKTGSTGLSSSVEFETQDGSATTADNDYVSNTGTLSFGPTDTSMTITVLVNGDTTFEPNEAFTVHLSNAVDATISDADGTGTITNDDAAPPLIVTIAPAGSPTITDNDYTRINNAVQATFSGQTIKLVGTFNWTEPNAAASWALGSDGAPNTLDDYSILVPDGINNVTFTADNLGDATIQGPGDLPALDLEGVFFFNASAGNQNWTISNIRFLDFDLAIGMFANSSTAYNNTHIVNNYIRVARDVAAATDTVQNIGIHYSFGLNQLISFNTIDIQGDGVTVGSNFASDVGMQSNTSGGAVYDGLQITNNTIQVLNEQSANPQVVIGIWENGHAHSSNISVSGNSFANLALGNNPATNLQRGFRVTSHSSGSSTVTYANNNVSGANLGFQWIAGSAFAGNLPVQLTNNALTGNGTGMLVQSQGQARLTNNRFTGSGAGSIGVRAIDGLTTVDVTKTTITGTDNAVVVDATSSGTDAVTMRITNSTLSGNLAASGGALYSVGTGGIARTTITNSTLSENSPGGTSIFLQDASLTVGNSIFNVGNSGTNISSNGGSAVTSLGYNLSRDNFSNLNLGGSLLTNTGDQLNTDPMLGPLKNNGGPTLTHAPLNGSPAIDKGKDIGPLDPTYSATGQDQRGLTRPITYDASIVAPAGGDRSDIGSVELALGVKPQSAASWLLHGPAGYFPIDLPLSGPVGVECRTGAVSGEYQVIVTFAQPITFSSADVTSGTGNVSGTSLSRPKTVKSAASGTQVTINLAGVTNAQTIVIALFDVNDGAYIGDVGIRMGMLLGDVNGVSGVTGTDVNACKMQVGANLSPTNFRSDVNTNGSVSGTDVNAIKAHVGTVLPP